MVGIVIINVRAVVRPLELHAAARTVERGKARGDIRAVHAHDPCGACGGQRIIDIVAAVDLQVHMAVALTEADNVKRAQAWGVIMREYKNAICVSGC